MDKIKEKYLHHFHLKSSHLKSQELFLDSGSVIKDIQGLEVLSFKNNNVNPEALAMTSSKWDKI